MTKKDFEMFAAALNEWRGTRYDMTDRDDLNRWYDLVSDVADLLETTNPRFDRVRFVVACGGPKA